MTLDELYQELLTQAESGELRINEATTGILGLDALISETLLIADGTIVVSNTDPQKISLVEGRRLIAQGTTAFLNVVDMPSTLVFQETTDGQTVVLDLVMTTNLPPTWTLGTSFYEFVGFPIDKVVLSEPHYVFSTLQHRAILPWYGSEVYMDVIRGLNSRAGIWLEGAFAVVTALLESVSGSISANPYFWYGSITQSITGEGPIANFKADLNIDIDLEFISLTNVFISADLDYVPIEENDDGSLVEELEFEQNQQLSFGGYVTLGVAPAIFSLDVAAMLSSRADGLMIGVQPAREETTTEQGITSVMGPGSSWDDLMPDWFRLGFLSLFSIKNITFSFAISPRPRLLLTRTTVGTLKPLEIIPGKFSAYVDVSWSVYVPLDVERRQTASLYAELAVLEDFVFIIEIFLGSGGDFSINGRYPGTITFTLAELSALLFDGALYDSSSPKIPADLATFSFSEFSLSFAITGAMKVWSFGAHADIAFNFWGLARLELNDVSLSVATTFGVGKTTYLGVLSGQIVIGRFSFYITAQVGSTIDTIFSVRFGNWSVGDFIAYMMEVVTGEEGYSLPSPWNVLNTINLDGLTITINMTRGTWGISYMLQRNINLGFITVTALGINYDSLTRAVNLDIGGSFFGQPVTQMNLMNPNTIPPVPGGGDGLFDLLFLAFGQRVRIDGLPPNASMSQIMTAMRHAFRQQPPTQVPVGTTPVKGELVFDPNSNWMIAAQMRVISAIDISVVFNDPNMYGLLISIAGEKLKKFVGLRFEILYRKVTDTIGVYQMELRLPDLMRTIRLGAISFTIPVIGIAVYTNGNFRLDFGFPLNNDFTRSFTVQVFPFIGSGGFYLAVLSEKTSTKLPVHDPERGTFNPVIEFGIGLDIGLGKNISTGILKAGLSLTLRGIVEGVFAFFNANKEMYPALNDEMYYRLKGTFSLFGKIYGEVNFSIIQAEVNIEVYAMISITIEAYKPILIFFEVAVRVSLVVRINLGLFKVNVRLAFSAYIRESFVIDMGSGTPPWVGSASSIAAFNGAIPRLRSLNRRALPQAVAMNWKPFELAEKQSLELLFLPQITAAVVGGGTEQQAVFATTLYLRTLAPDAEPGDESDDFSKLAEAVLLWSIASLIDTSSIVTDISQVLDQVVTRQNLRDVFDWLADAQPGVPPLTYAQIIAFLNGYFSIALESPESAGEFNVSVFPVIPELVMTATLNDTVVKQVDFATETLVDSNYHREIQLYFEKLAVRYRTELEAGVDAADEAARMRAAFEEEKESLATYIFRDFFTILARANVQNAIDLLAAFNHTAAASDTLDSLAAAFGSTPALIAQNNISLLLGVQSIVVSGVVYQTETAQSFDGIAAMFGLTGADADSFLNDLGTLNQDVPGLLAEGAVIVVGNSQSYTVVARDTLQSVAQSYAIAPGELVVLNRALTTMLVAQIPLAMPDVSRPCAEGDTLDSIANYYNAPIAALAAANGAAAGLFATGQAVTLPNVESATVRVIVDKMKENFSFVNLGGMSGRYLLHGMRVPPPGGEVSAQFRAEWPGAQTYALYALTGQEFALPTLVETDIFSVALALPIAAKRQQWFALRKAMAAATEVQITFTPTQIAEAAAMAGTVLNPGVDAFRPLRIYRQEAARYNLTNSLLWQSSTPVSLPGSAATKAFVKPMIWNVPVSFMAAIQTPKVLPPVMQLMAARQEQPNQPMAEQPVQNFAWATRVPLTVRQVPIVEGSGDMQPFTFEIAGTDDAGKTLLEKLLQYYYQKDPAIIHEVNILYNPNPAGANPEGLAADGASAISAFILKTNLSTVANPVMLARAHREEVDETIGNLLNEQPAQSLLQIWEASVVRSGGFYLYYCVDSTNSGLPTSIFNENADAVLTLVITLNITGNTLPDFVNCAVVGDDIGEEGYVFAESQRRDVDIMPTSSTTLRSLLANYRISLATLAEVLSTKVFAAGAVLNLNGVVFETDSNDWTLAMIAQKFNVSEQDIRALNPGVDFDNLTTWTALHIPPTTTTIAGSNTTVIDVAIANRLAVEALLYANLDKPGLLAGTAISIPDQYTALAATIPVGNTAFELWRTNPDLEQGAVSTEARDANHSLELLYNLLGFGVVANQDFDASVEALPIGFSDNDASQQAINARTRPEQASEGDYWKYSTVLPVTPFVQQAALLSAATGAPDPALNPYAGVGKLLQIHAAWQDMFGNQTYTPFTDSSAPHGAVLNNMPIDIGYFDNLIGVESWPSVNTGYRFALAPTADGDVPTLGVLLSFDPASYLPGDEENAAPFKEVALADLEVYRKVYYQLSCDDTAIALSTNLNSRTVQVDSAAIVGFVASIFAYLGAISQPAFEYTYYITQEGDTIESIALQYGVSEADIERLNPDVPFAPAAGTRIVIPTIALPPNLTVSAEAPFANAEAVFALSVVWTISREEQYIDGQFAGEPGVRRATTVLFPLTEKTAREEEGGGYFSLEQFAKDFEAAYPQAKTAVSPSELNDTMRENIRTIWVVQFGPGGIQYSIDTEHPLYFAPIPLANQLITGSNFTVYPYMPGQGMDFDHPMKKTFAGIDLDVWARPFLEAVDQFLSPAYAVPAFIVDQTLGTTYYRDVLDAKGEIAAAYKPLVQNLDAENLGPSYAGNREAAASMIEQLLLTTLASAYDTTSIVQYNVEVTPASGMAAAALFGQPMAPDGASVDSGYSVSTSRIATGKAASYLTYVFTARQPEQQQSFDLDLVFRINALEYDIRSVGPEFGEYNASSWLSFIVPPTPDALGSASIPVPLRAYPTPPSLVGQWALPEHTRPEGGAVLAHTRRWKYSYAYEPVSAAQDRIHTNIRFNVQSAQFRTQLANEPDLFQALALFTNVYAAMQPDIINIVGKITQSSTVQQMEIAAGVLQDFSFLVTAVADAWGSWMQMREQYLSPALSEDDIEYCVEEFSNVDAQFQMNFTQLVDKGSSVEFPQPAFDGYTTVEILNEGKRRGFVFQSQANPDQYLTSAEADAVHIRTVEFTDLDIMETQNAWAGVFIARNENLFDEERTCTSDVKTNPNFLYRTPTIRFSNVVTPLLDWPELFNIAELQPGVAPPQSMSAWLQVMFTAFFEGIPYSAAEPTERQIMVSSTYSYLLNPGEPGSEPIDVSVPLMMSPPFGFIIPTDWSTDCGEVQSFVCRLSEFVEAWFRANRPSTDGGRFVFDIAAFSSLNDSKLPVYRLRRLYLLVADIANIV